MSTKSQQALGLALGAAIIVTLFLLVDPHNASMAKGLAQGGAFALAVAAFAFWRANRNPGGVSAAERGMAGLADERDNRVTEKALAFAGLASFGWMAMAVLLIGVGVRPEIPGAVMVWGQLVTLIGAYVWHSRRM
ncbi:MAG: hypothetical protein V9G04_18120 [Nocardioides sp.]|jgi:hypothetical protein